MIATRDNLTDFRPHSFAAPRLDATRPEDLIGNTPLLRLDRTAAAYALSTRVTLLAKAEWYNPGGSVKDRAALHIIREAERRALPDGFE